MTDVTEEALGRGNYDHLILAAPTVDITNLDTSKVKHSDDTEPLKKKVATSCDNMMKIAENALAKNPALKNVTIMNHTPRYDLPNIDPLGLKQKLAHFANSYILESWMDSQHKKKIIIGSHSLECPIETRKIRYTDEQSGWYDGVHPYGSAGKMAYTESFVNILLYSLLPQDTGKDFHPERDHEEDHTSVHRQNICKSRRESITQL